MNPDLTSTIQLVELVWTLVALPGVYLWAQNAVDARQSRRAVKQLGLTNGRAVFANYAARSTLVWLGVELLFVTLGVLAMTTLPNPNSSTVRTLVISFGLIAASAAITYLGLEWRRVDQALLRIARDRLRDMNNLDAREAGQNVRENGQNTREAEQNDRDFRQDKRQDGQDRREHSAEDGVIVQNTRETDQNEREVEQNDRDDKQDEREKRNI